MSHKSFAFESEHKSQIFPEEKLPCRITLDDLDEDDMKSFRSGSYQPLPSKDQAGRSVLVVNATRIKFEKSWKNEVRLREEIIVQELKMFEMSQRLSFSICSSF